MQTINAVPKVGDHVRYLNKQSIRWEYGTVTAISKQNAMVFHVKDHNPTPIGYPDGRYEECSVATVHYRRIDRVILAGRSCGCGRTRCPDREVTDETASSGALALAHHQR